MVKAPTLHQPLTLTDDVTVDGIRSAAVVSELAERLYKAAAINCCACKTGRQKRIRPRNTTREFATRRHLALLSLTDKALGGIGAAIGCANVGGGSSSSVAALGGRGDQAGARRGCAELAVARADVGASALDAHTDI